MMDSLTEHPFCVLSLVYNGPSYAATFAIPRGWPHKRGSTVIPTLSHIVSRAMITVVFIIIQIRPLAWTSFASPISCTTQPLSVYVFKS